MVVLAALGGAIEYYDFVAFGIFAPAIATSFFGKEDARALTISLAIFALGYVARPVGGLVSSHFGDRHGRKIVFVTTIMLMAGATMAIGLIPSYARIGIAAPLLLLAMRLVQGLCIGAELPGAITYVVETVDRRPALACGVVFALVNLGVLLATLLNVALTLSLAAPDVTAFGWRFAFILGGMLGFASLWLRRRLEETPEFLRARTQVAARPIAEVVRRQPWELALGVAVAAPTAMVNGLFFGYLPGYLTIVLHYEAREVAAALNLALLVISLGLIAAAWLADHIPARRMLLVASLALMLAAPLLFTALVAHAAPLVLLLALLGSCVAPANGTFAFLLANLFPSRRRFSGTALSLNISFTALSGLGPLMATAAIATSGTPSAPGWIIAAAALLGAAAAMALAAARDHLR